MSSSERESERRNSGLCLETLHLALRVTDLAESLAFYETLGYAKLGRVDLDGGVSLTMLKLPNDEWVKVELVHRPGDDQVEIGTGFDYFVVQVDDLEATIERLTEAGLAPTPIETHGGPGGTKTSVLTDPDGYQIELVQWPPGHPPGMTEFN